MIIELTPMRRDDCPAVSRQGDILTIDGIAYDFSAIPDGAILPRDAVACDWLASDVERRDGTLRLTLIAPHGPDAPDRLRAPRSIALVADGEVVIA